MKFKKRIPFKAFACHVQNMEQIDKVFINGNLQTNYKIDHKNKLIVCNKPYFPEGMKGQYAQIEVILK